MKRINLIKTISTIGIVGITGIMLSTTLTSCSDNSSNTYQKTFKNFNELKEFSKLESVRIDDSENFDSGSQAATWFTKSKNVNSDFIVHLSILTIVNYADRGESIIAPFVKNFNTFQVEVEQHKSEYNSNDNCWSVNANASGQNLETPMGSIKTWTLDFNTLDFVKAGFIYDGGPYNPESDTSGYWFHSVPYWNDEMSFDDDGNLIGYFKIKMILEDNTIMYLNDVLWSEDFRMQIPEAWVPNLHFNYLHQ